MLLSNTYFSFKRDPIITVPRYLPKGKNKKNVSEPVMVDAAEY
jgi:hypothetical protein